MKPPTKDADRGEPRRLGRPKSEEPGTSLTAWIPASEYDRILKLAKQSEQSISAFVRDSLKQQRG